jgi:CubicO group peptidase (beta-lactamase class C family)
MTTSLEPMPPRLTTWSPAPTPPWPPTRRRTPDLSGIGAPARAGIDAGVIPCAVIGVSDGFGTLHLQALAGPVDRPTVQTRFFLASVTKPVVATAVMQLVDEGRLDLHASLARLLPELDRPGARDITAWHVLTHTAGLADLPTDELRTQRPSYPAMLQRVLIQTPEWPPGSRHRYCSDSFYLLAEAIARLTGMPFAEALRVRLLDPLGMRDTTFDARPVRRVTMPVHGIPMRNMVVRELILRFLARATLPGGGLFGTAEDLLRFGRALLPRREGAGPRVVSGAAIAEMTREQTAGIPAFADDGTVHEPRYGLGWRTPSEVDLDGPVDRDDPEAGAIAPAIRPSPGTFTHGGASGTRLWIDPGRDLVFVFLTNIWDGDRGPGFATLERVYAAWDAAG